MNPAPTKPYLQIYLYLVFLAGIGLLVFQTAVGFPSFLRPEPILLLTLVVAFLANFPLRLLQSEITMIQAITLGVGLLYGPAQTGWIVAVGILTGQIFRQLWWFRREGRSFTQRPLWLEIGYAIGMQVIPISLALAVFDWDATAGSSVSIGFQGAALLLALVFALIHSALFQLEFWLRGRISNTSLTRDLISLGLVELLPIPFVLLAVAAFPDNPVGSLIVLSAVPATIAVLMYGVNTARSDLERRLQDLSTLNYISRTLQSTLEPEKLLTAIQHQLTQQLEVDNFYVALYDLKDQQIWYPLAVKHGVRREWPRRPLTDRLTDRVILEKRPIMLAREAGQELARIGLPPSEDAPYAWLGAPLITSERTIGCLAVFSTSPAVEFSPADQDLLTIMSGQVSVALENALLYEQVQYRAGQLDTLNRLSTAISASLDLNEVLAQVCRSVTQVSGAQRSAIFLINPDQGEIQLAYALGISQEFSDQNRAFPLSRNGRTRCLRTGRPVLVPDIHLLSEAEYYIQGFISEGIHAFGDFPLVTPEGQIGFLSVYFDEATTFRPEQVDLLQTFASQAALAVSNARLHARTDLALSRRAQQLSILEKIASELAAVIHSERLFELVLDHALEYTRAPWGSLSLYDPQKRLVEIKASRGYQSEQRLFPDSEGITGRVIRTRKAINLGDVSKDPEYIQLTPEPAQAQVSVPLVYEDRVLGVITLESPDARAFTSRDQAFIGQLATQAAIAVVNAELYTETRRRLREQATLYQVSRRLVGNLNLERVVETIAQGIGAALESDATGVYMPQPDRKTWRLRAIYPTGGTTKSRLPSNLQEDPWLNHIPERLEAITPHEGTVTTPQATAFNKTEEIQQLVFPLTIAEQHLGVVLAYLAKDRVISEEDLQLPRAMAAQGAIAIQNALLFADVMKGHDQMQAVLNSVDDGVLMVDAEGRISLGNASIHQLLGVSEEELITKHLTDLKGEALQVLGLTPKQAEGLIQNLGQVPGAITQRVTLSHSGEQRERVLERLISPVWGQGRRVIGWVFVVRDITEEDELNQARELITETLVHDLRSPVGAVDSALNLMDEMLPDQSRDEVTSQAMRIARRSTARVLSLINSLLDISRMESGIIELDLAPVHLDSLIDDICNEFVPQAAEIGIVLQNQFPSDLAPVRADVDKIGRVVANLLDNAIKFTPEGGQVIVTGETLDSSMVAIHVSDSGPGIPEEYRTKIFERFSQIPAYRGRRRGSGLGLTFCRLAVEAHGGRIWVSPRPGGGSTFTFSLPIQGK